MNDPKYIDVVCEKCGKKYKVKPSQEEKKYRCKECGDIMVVEPVLNNLDESNEIKQINPLSMILRIITILMLFIAVGNLSYSYYQILRFIVCGVSGYMTYLAFQKKKKFWIWIFGITTILFNPISPIYLEKDIWVIVDIFIAITLFISLFYFQFKKTNRKLIIKILNIFFVIIFILIGTIRLISYFESQQQNRTRVVRPTRPKRPQRPQ